MESQWGSHRERQETAGSSSVAPRRRSRFLRRRQTTVAFEDLMADLARLESMTAESTAPIDPADRALLLQLYRELVGTVEGPVVPFPVELMDDPANATERPQPAELVDLAAFRLRRDQGGAAATDGSGGTPR